LLASHISERTITIIGGALFILLAIATIVFASKI
jgi:putative Ca2+/H+ antiporter (TMEM165/GDT1 family)